ncbi:hypothetical protein ACGFRG_02090 [Streptomyces sp. NPDC048696]|uniref:hypothetical protein n=1 Tax=Streptomyces sp. NPDC048696 TaxID=3365585 RepID=UPI0037219A98
MALSDVQLSLLAFPQRWTGTELQARVLLLPVGDPTAPPTPTAGLPKFSGTSWQLRALVRLGRDALYGGTPSGVLEVPFTATAPAGATALFDALGQQFRIEPPESDPQRLARLAGTSFRKQLPSSYTDAFAFERPGPGTTLGEEFGCELRDTAAAVEGDPKPPQRITWGAVLSFALRQPLMARTLGLIHDLTIPVADPAQLARGGWLYLELDPTGPVTPTGTDTVRRYAALLPPLTTAARPLFAAVLFPVGLAGGYDTLLAEAADYDDGFAKIVHTAQAVTADAGTSGHNQLKPATDAGIDVGWDDEQVTLWLTRQLDALRARLDPTASALEAPLGVGGYRVDVRMPDVPAHTGWTSLCRAHSIGADGKPAPLSFPPPPATPVFSQTFQGELTVEPVPARSVHSTTGTAWLPMYFTRWQGDSLVVADPTLYELMGTRPKDGNHVPIDVPAATYAAPATPVPLRYGQRYEFRCRFADLTGGGPGVDDTVLSPGDQPTGATRFLRHIPPSTLRITTDVPVPAPHETRPPVTTVHTIKVRRPLIGYPALVFAGVDAPTAFAALRADAPTAKKEGRGVGVSDPDVTGVRVAVDVRLPAHDPLGTDTDGFYELYQHEAAFPAYGPGGAAGSDPEVALTLDYVDQPDIATLPRPADGATTLPVPSARDIRLRLTAVCADKPDYFDEDATRTGMTSHLATRAEAAAESALFPAVTPSWLHAMFLQPGPDPADRVAKELALTAQGLALSARAGERVLFGVSNALRHTLGGDHAALTFADEEQLLGQWIVAIELDLVRDWTWDGLKDEGIVVHRHQDTAPHTDPNDLGPVIGQLRVPFVVSADAMADGDGGTAAGGAGADRRRRTRLIFFDAIDPQPAPGAFPAESTPRWTFAPKLLSPTSDEGTQQRVLSVRLPVAVKPRQTPTVVSAGIALSPYTPGDAYASTEPRRRVLWFELDEPVADPQDAVFARAVSSGPDPLLSGRITNGLRAFPDTLNGATTWFEQAEAALPNPPPPPPLPIDPEPIRVIHPQQPDDDSGFGAMTRMTAAKPTTADPSPRHFIVPLPEGVAADAPELFGFWTYELRIGHTPARWSTAQARFGRALIIKGVQHPPPLLRCTALRDQPSPYEASQIVVTAPYACAVFEGTRLTNLRQGDPRTQIWALLYGQVVQADGTDHRNVLLARAPAPPRLDDGPVDPRPASRDLIGVATFDTSQVATALDDLALPADTPLSVITVELLPAEGQPQRDASATASDPLGADLGLLTSQRILRCSPLTPIPPAC